MKSDQSVLIGRKANPLTSHQSLVGLESPMGLSLKGSGFSLGSLARWEGDQRDEWEGLERWKPKRRGRGSAREEIRETL